MMSACVCFNGWCAARGGAGRCTHKPTSQKNPTNKKTNESNLTDTLTQLHLANNDFEGDLSALAAARPLIAKVHNNPRLCGMVPAGIRFAKAYNPAGTQLGQPCPQEAKGAAGAATGAAAPPSAQRQAPKL